MLEISMAVERGIPFLNLEGILNTKTFSKLGNEINYLLYKQGFQYFVLDFSHINDLEDEIYTKIQSKLVEIFLSCGRVVLCGVDHKEKIGYTKDKLHYVNQKQEAFQYLYL